MARTIDLHVLHFNGTRPRACPALCDLCALHCFAQLLAEFGSYSSQELAAQLRKRWNIDFDDAGAIGRRYRRQDEIGTPLCITYDFDSLDDGAVTIRKRDDMSQERVSLDQVEAYLAEHLGV